MKSLLYFVVSALLASLFLMSPLSAATGEDATGAVVIPVENPLLVETITTVDDSHITLVFNQDIIRESVRVRIAKQSDESGIRIESFTGGADDKSINVSLSDPIETSTSYKMTIISAISDAGIIIKDGADGIKEFTTPTTLKKYNLALNAPSNPSAVLATGSQVGSRSSGATMTPTTVKKETPPSDTTAELPLTGIDPTLFVILAAAIALLLISRRQRV